MSSSPWRKIDDDDDDDEESFRLHAGKAVTADFDDGVGEEDRKKENGEEEEEHNDDDGGCRPSRRPLPAHRSDAKGTPTTVIHRTASTGDGDNSSPVPSDPPSSPPGVSFVSVLLSPVD